MVRGCPEVRHTFRGRGALEFERGVPPIGLLCCGLFSKVLFYKSIILSGGVSVCISTTQCLVEIV